MEDHSKTVRDQNENCCEEASRRETQRPNRDTLRWFAAMVPHSRPQTGPATLGFIKRVAVLNNRGKP